MPDHPYGWLSLAPPLIAIVLAMLTRRVIASLLAGILAGALITSGWNPIVAIGSTVEIHLWKTLADEDKLRVFAFTLLMGAMVGVINASGGMHGLVQVVSRWANNRRRGQLVTWLLGLLVFFDDYANTVLLGGTLRPLCDRLKISREKLAYLVDSTAAPVAGLALVSTWVAGEIDYVQEGLDKLPAGLEWNAFELFLHSIPYRFYVLWALLFVPMVALFGRDFGPMRRAEQQARHSRDDEAAASAARREAPWYFAVVPVLIAVGSIVFFLYRTGVENCAGAESPSLIQIFGQSDAFGSLTWGALAGFVAAVVLVVFQGRLDSAAIRSAAGDGARLMLPALAILWMASSLSLLTGNKPIDGVASNSQVESSSQVDPSAFAARDYRMYTGEFLGSVLTDRLPTWLLPTAVFVLAAVVSFATGTSWGTMGIVMPLVVPLAYSLVPGSTADHPILLSSIGSVLAGSIFGDHCSPISDTTVLSSQSTGCNHVAHVVTQLPYAVLIGVISIVCGTIPVGLGISVWIMLPAGVLLSAACLLVFGRLTD